MKVYPVFLNDLRGLRCVVFGGGHEAVRKVEELVHCEAAIVVVSPEVDPPLRALAEAGTITWMQRRYEKGDLEDAFLAIVSETNPKATAPIYEEAERARVLINAMDDIPHCTFVAGSVVRRGQLTISISTSGAAPAFSVRLRERLEREIGPEYEDFLEMLSAIREPMAERHPDFETRRTLWYDIVDSDILEVLRREGRAAALQRISEIADIQPEAAVR